MNIVAVDTKSGKVIMTHSGSMSEESFKQTVLSMFPQYVPSDIAIICDGNISQLRNRAGSGPAPTGRSVIWKGSFSDLGGYANMNREICLRLGHHGISVKVDILKTGWAVDPMTTNLLRALETTKLKDEASCPMVVGFTPMSIRSRRKALVFYTMMETQGLHKEFVNRCNEHATELWVPCKFYLDVFKANGISKPVKLMPLGVNHHIYVPGTPEPRLSYEAMPTGQKVQTLPKSFRFMSLFGWSYRKGPDVLCRSFLKEFSTKDDVCLVIYSRYAGSSMEQHKDTIRKEIREYYKESGPDAPPIYYCGDHIPIQDLPGCYAAANAFVFCSRGEGFGLPVVEAGACGLPVISAYNTAMTQYLDEDTAFLVSPEGVAPANDKLTWITEYYRDQDFAVYGDKSIAEFGGLMRLVYRNPQEAAEKAKKLRERILNEYTWDVATSRVASRLKELTK